MAILVDFDLFARRVRLMAYLGLCERLVAKTVQDVRCLLYTSDAADEL